MMYDTLWCIIEGWVRIIVPAPRSSIRSKTSIDRIIRNHPKPRRGDTETGIQKTKIIPLEGMAGFESDFWGWVCGLGEVHDYIN